MTPEPPPTDPAISLMTMDLLSQILLRSDKPSEMGRYLSEEIRELTGARCVLLLQSPNVKERSGSHILIVHPERRREWAESDKVAGFFESHLNDAAPAVWNGRDEATGSDFLQQEGFGLSISIPLKTGEIPVGVLFALGLPDILNLDSVITLLSTLSPIVALVLRNAILFEQQENIIAERTVEIHAAYEEIFSELEGRKIIEQRLREVSEFRESVISSARVWIMVIDQEGIVLLWNTAAEEITGYPAVDVVGRKNIWRLLYPDAEYRRITTQNIRQIIAGKKVLDNFETTVTTRTGERKIISWNTKEIQSGREEKPQFIAIGVDVTDQKLAEKRLQMSEQRFSDLFTRSQNAIAIYQPVENGENFLIVDFNPAAEAIEKVNRDEIIGKLVTDVFPGVREFGLFNVFQRVNQTGMPEYHDASFYRDERIEGWRENMVYRLPSGEIVAMYNDVTERKRQEEMIREKNAYLENLISIANVPILVWDREFHITRINHACEDLMGRSEAEVTGCSLENFSPPEQAERSARLLKTTGEGVRWVTVRIDILHKNGSVRNVVWNSATLYSSDGSTRIATIAQGRDITDELNLEREKDAALVQIQKNLAQLAILNDEIRNPLSIIEAYTEMYSDPKVAGPVTDQIRKIDNLINHLDQRWIQSEKVLNAIRKHYHLYVSPDTDSDQAGMSMENSVSVPPDSSRIPRQQELILPEEILAELYTILDSIDALIYVADMETYDLLYLNNKARNLFGDIGGKKCYRVIYLDQEKPCSFCTNSRLTGTSGPTGVYIWETQNNHNGRWYDCRDRAIRWTDGRIVRLEIATDITERKESEEVLKKTIEELQRFNALTVGREIRMTELKAEVNTLLKAAGKEEKYRIEK
jgi:PAS domain S-box-containing protein